MTASAQIYVGGQIGFSTSSVNADTEGSSSISGTSFKILPEVGYKLNDKWAVGIQVGYSQGISAFGTFDVNDFRFHRLCLLFRQHLALFQKRQSVTKELIFVTL